MKTVTVFKFNKKSLMLGSKTFKNFNKNVHNSNKNEFVYYNYNHENGLWECPLIGFDKKILQQCKSILISRDLCQDTVNCFKAVRSERIALLLEVAEEYNKGEKNYNNYLKDDVSLQDNKEILVNEIKQGISLIKDFKKHTQSVSTMQ